MITAAKLDQVQKYLSLTRHVIPAGRVPASERSGTTVEADKQAFLTPPGEGVR